MNVTINNMKQYETERYVRALCKRRQPEQVKMITDKIYLHIVLVSSLNVQQVRT